MINFSEGPLVKERRTASHEEKSIVLSTPRSGTEAERHRYDQTLHKLLSGHIRIYLPGVMKYGLTLWRRRFANSGKLHAPALRHTNSLARRLK